MCLFIDKNDNQKNNKISLVFLHCWPGVLEYADFTSTEE